uniref:hypothetical protein n=1 Tax=Methanomethylovorans sp. TaxID=2758717 RepID=UPI00351C28AA
SETGTVQEKLIDHELLITPLKTLDAYNKESLKPKEISKLADSRYESFLSKAPENSLILDSMKSFRDDFMPKYARASLLSKFYQKWYFRAGAMIYVFSALAVATVTLQTLFYPEHPEILWLEVLYMMGILITVYVSNKIGIHRRWIDYRFLAERMRTAIFFTIAGIGHAPLGYLPYVSKSQQTDYWLVKAFSWIWNTLPQNPQASSMDFSRLKAYMKTFWVEDQLKFYLEKSHENRSTHERYELMGVGMFILTLIAAFLHASKLEHFVLGHEVVNPNVLASFGIILPAIGASLAGILSKREFLKNSARYEQMLSPLKGICKQMDDVKNMDQLIELLEQANDLILRENQDWRVSFLSQRLRPL